MLASLLRNTAFSIVTHLLSRVGNTVLLVFIIRQIALDSGGQYDLGLSWFFIGSRFAFWGLDHLITREIAKDRSLAPKWIVNLLAARLVLALLTITIILLVLPLMPYTPATRLIITLFTLSILPENINNLCLGIYAGFEEYHFSTVGTFINIVVKVVGGVIAIYAGYGLPVAVAIILAGHSIAMLVNLTLIKKRYLAIRPRPSISLSFLRHIFPQTVPFIFIGMFYILDNRFDRILMSLLSTNEEIGVYASASTFLTALILPAQGYRIAVLPVMARLRDKGEQLQQLYYRSYKLLLLAAVPLAMITGVAAENMIAAVYGKTITDSIPTLRILVAALAFFYLNTLYNRILIVYDRQGLTARFMTITTFLNFVVNLWLIPRLGAEGAAFGRFASALALFVLNTWVVHKLHSIRPLASMFMRLFAVTASAVGALLWVWPYGVLVSAAVFMLVYTAGLLVGGIISPDERALLKKAVVGRF